MDVAIVGMAGRFPGAKNIDELFTNLSQGIDSVLPITQQRIRDTALPLDRPYRNCGYLNDIDKFDYNLFGISNSEAINMCPSQRLLLETAYSIFENAGYNVDHFNGTNTSVYTANSGDYHYYKHADQFNITLMTGNSQEFTPARIARHFNLMGNAIAINTACSSSIVAIHMACNDLVQGDADSVLVCSINLDFFPFDEVLTEVKMTSSDGKSRAFSEQADGMSFGETACGVLLKPLDKAIEDGDIIHAVIKGSAINNNGNLSSSIIAPSSVRQGAVIKKAWKRANIGPNDVGFIETHGSGTQIGDCLEAEGLAIAIRESEKANQKIPISTVKSNLGHCMLASGMVGLIKTVLSLKHEVLFPNLHSETLNSKIDFDKAGIKVNTELKAWPLDSKEKYAGVSSLGRSGVNSHIVLKNFTDKSVENVNYKGKQFLFTISSANKEGLKENIKSLINYLNNNSDISINDLSYTMNHGRKHYQYKTALIAADISTLKLNLEKFVNETVESINEEIDNSFIILSDQPEISIEVTNKMLTEHAELFKNIESIPNLDNPQARAFLFQYGMYQLLCTHNIVIKNFISFGVGKIVKDVILDKISLSKGLEMAILDQSEKLVELDSKIHNFMNKEGGSHIALIDLGVESEISKSFRRLYPEKTCIVSTKEDSNYSILNILEKLYCSNINIEWNHAFDKEVGNRIELPTYNFKRNRCWLRDEPLPAFGGQDQNSTTKSLEIIESASELEGIVAHIYANVLSLDEISLNDNFFELGGNSLKSTKVINLINEKLKVQLDFEDIFDFPTVRELCTYLFAQTNTKEVLISIWKLIFKTDNIKETDDFFDLGGHSLMATELIDRIKGILNVELNFEDIYTNGELGQLAEFINELINNSSHDLKVKSLQIPRAEEKEEYPVSYAQRRIVLLEKFYKLGSSYNMPGAFTIDGDFDLDQMKSAFQKLIERHESFRASFYIDGTVIKQKILNNLSVPINYQDLSIGNLSDDEKEIRLKELISDGIQPFDLSQPPFLRVLLVRLEEYKWVLMYDINHIVIDRHSYDLITKDFMALYNNQKLDELAIQYKDYAEWQQHYFNSEQFLSKEKYWLDTFKKPLEEFNLPTDFERPTSRESKAEVYYLNLDSELTEQIKKTAKQYNVTLYVFLLTAFKVMLHRLTKQKDIRIGSPFSERSNPSLKSVVGILHNTIVLRTFPEGKKTFDQYLLEVMETSTKAYKNADYQFEMLLDKIGHKRETNRNPLFDILFNSQMTVRNQNTDIVSIPDQQLTIKPYNLTQKVNSNFDISILVDDIGSTIDYKVTYQISLFKESTIEYYMNQYKSLLSQVVADPSQNIEKYSIFDRSSKNNSKRIKLKRTI